MNLQNTIGASVTPPLQRTLHIAVFFALICWLLVPFNIQAGERPKGNLVGVDWVERNMGQKNILILDASMAQQYALEHIPGSVNADVFGYGGKDIPIDIRERRFQSWGISNDTKIIIYDRDRPMMATRLFFDLYYNGFPLHNLFILDGGLTKWKASGKKVTQEPPPSPKNGSFKIVRRNESELATLPEVLAASGDRQKNVLLEALDANWHYGGLQFFSRPGHIPHSILLPSDDFVNQDKTFKTEEEIAAMLKYYDVKKEQTIYTYCGGGIAASVPYFVLKFMLHYPHVKLFSASELGWLQDERDLPFWTYDKPYLMRETDWLKSWGGKMMRMYGVSEVNIIDIRSAEEFSKGHIPFALNVPYDSIQNNFANAENMYNTFLRAGINPNHEAVIVSDKGITEQSALAFLTLEYLGLKKVSIFTDSNEKFAQSGIKLTVDQPQNSSAIAASQPLAVRHEIVVTHAARSTGIFPPVYISSGNYIPKNLPAGNVIRLQYSDLLDTNGKSKTAKEIWKILQDAGIPRYAELICVSQNPGEAAVNYFILKLMGFPDVKVFAL